MGYKKEESIYKDREEQEIEKEIITTRKYKVLSGYEINHKGKKYFCGDIIELNQEEKDMIKIGIEEYVNPL